MILLLTLDISEKMSRIDADLAISIQYTYSHFYVWYYKYVYNNILYVFRKDWRFKKLSNVKNGFFFMGDWNVIQPWNL